MKRTQKMSVMPDRNSRSKSLSGRQAGKSLFFLGLRRLVQLLDVTVGHLLDFVVRAAVVILADDLVLREFLDGFVGVTADVTQRDAVILRHMIQLLNQVLAALFRQCRYGN